MSQIICSVIVPVYNVENTLERCIESILTAKEENNIEIILVNDGSTDDSLQICKNYEVRYSYITVINQLNKGLPGARNSGLNIAKGEYIAFLDSDDTISADYFKVLVPYFNTGYKMIEFGYSRIAEGGNRDFLPVEQVFNRKQILQNVSISSQNRLLWFVWRRVYNLNFIRTYDITFNENIKYGEDTDFSIKIFQKLNSYKTISKSLYNYHENEFSLTGQKYKDNLLQKYEIQYLERKKKLFDEIEEEIQFKDISKNYINNSLLALLNNLKNSPKEINLLKELNDARNSIIYQECFKFYHYDWKHLRRSLFIKLFELKQYKLLLWFLKYNS